MGTLYMPFSDEEHWQHVDEGCFPYLTARGTDEVYMSNVRILYNNTKTLTFGVVATVYVLCLFEMK